MGMDLHSSGITTSVLGALKRGLSPLSANSASTCAAAAVVNRGRIRLGGSSITSRDQRWHRWSLTRLPTVGGLAG